jgi:membrane associated rhomboid family serine protease
MTDLVLPGGDAARPADAAAAPWRAEPPLPAGVLGGSTHGYLHPGGQVQRCDRAELVKQLRREPWTEAVFVPEITAPRPEGEAYAQERLAPVRPEAAGLLDEYRRALVRAATRDAILLALLTLMLGAWALSLYAEAGFRTLPGLFTAFAAALTLLGVHGIHQARRVDAGAFALARQTRRHWTWARAQPAVVTWMLVVGLAGVHLLTMDVEAAVAGAGLVKPAVWDGEAWRMLTGPMLHGGIYHAWMNLSALFALGYLVEAHTDRHHLAVAFLASVAGGSVLSLLLSGRPSIGASGGVMGLVGVLWVLWRLRPADFPDDFGGRMKYVVGATALIGIVGVEFIDNWAHLGGLLAGAGTAWLLLRGRTEGRARRWAMHAAGIVSLAVLLAAMIWAVRGTWTGPAPGSPALDVLAEEPE